MSYADAGYLSQRILLWFTVFMPPAMIAGKVGRAKRATGALEGRQQLAIRPLVEPSVIDEA